MFSLRMRLENLWYASSTIGFSFRILGVVQSEVDRKWENDVKLQAAYWVMYTAYSFYGMLR